MRRAEVKTRLSLTAFALLAVAGCGSEAPRGGLSAEEERRLDNAAKMLDEGIGNLSFDMPEAGNAVAENSAAGR